MFKLIRKDLLLQKRILMTMLPLLLISIYLTTSVIWVAIIFCIAFTMDVFTKDESPSTNLFWNALPFTRKEIVSSKYIGALIYIFLVLITIFIGNLIMYQELIQWEQILLIMSIVLTFISFAFPFSYLFKSQYLLIASGVLFVLYLIIINTFVPNLNDIIREITQFALSMEYYQLYLLVFLAIVVLYIFSWMLSIRIYSRKIF